MAADLLTYSIKNCDFSYGGQSCLENLSVDISQAGFHGLIGPNGSGKTTFINLLAGLVSPQHGQIVLFDREISSYTKTELATLLSLVPQIFNMGFDFTVRDVVMMGRHPYIPRFGSPSKVDTQAVAEALATLDVSHLQDRFITQLSGGERQRVLVSRALAQQTSVMLLDEATASLDIKHSIDIMRALKQRVTEHGATVVAAIHDLDLAAAFCDNLIVMEQGAVVANGPVETVLSRKLLNSVFQVDATITTAPDTPTPHIQYRYSNEA